MSSTVYAGMLGGLTSSSPMPVQNRGTGFKSFFYPNSKPRHSQGPPVTVIQGVLFLCNIHLWTCDVPSRLKSVARVFFVIPLAKGERFFLCTSVVRVLSTAVVSVVESHLKKCYISSWVETQGTLQWRHAEAIANHHERRWTSGILD